MRMQEQLISIGILLILIGFALLIIGSILTALKGKAKTEWAVGGIFWFVPFGFGTKENLVKLAIVISVAILLLLIVLNLLGR